MPSSVSPLAPMNAMSTLVRLSQALPPGHSQPDCWSSNGTIRGCTPPVRLCVGKVAAGLHDLAVFVRLLLQRSPDIDLPPIPWPDIDLPELAVPSWLR